MMYPEYGVFVTSGGKTQRQSTTSTSFELTHLVAKAVYTVKVTAINRAGRESLITGRRGVTFETKVATPPSTPWGLVAFSSTGGAIEVAWNAPVDSGGMSLDDMIYNVTMFPIAPCFKAGSDVDDHCAACKLVKLQGNEQYELVVNGVACERPVSSVCSDGTSSCCLTRADSEFGSGLQCLVDDDQRGKQRHRLVVGSNTTVFHGLNHSTTYFFGVRANNLVGSSGISTIAGLQTQ